MRLRFIPSKARGLVMGVSAKKVKSEAEEELSARMPLGAIRQDVVVYKDMRNRTWCLNMMVWAFGGLEVGAVGQAQDLSTLRYNISAVVDKLNHEFKKSVPIPKGVIIIWEIEEL